ncbi:hypothetical protein N0V90_010951 [Kalmusia sp. IMI 367209]|nr:hypothetical protein N0V90_010951 [Kalmusia sp. IMI 367209]
MPAPQRRYGQRRQPNILQLDAAEGAPVSQRTEQQGNEPVTQKSKGDPNADMSNKYRKWKHHADGEDECWHKHPEAEPHKNSVIKQNFLSVDTASTIIDPPIIFVGTASATNILGVSAIDGADVPSTNHVSDTSIAGKNSNLEDDQEPLVGSMKEKAKAKIETWVEKVYSETETGQKHLRAQLAAAEKIREEEISPFELYGEVPLELVDIEALRWQHVDLFVPKAQNGIPETMGITPIESSSVPKSDGYSRHSINDSEDEVDDEYWRQKDLLAEYYVIDSRQQFVGTAANGKPVVGPQESHIRENIRQFGQLIREILEG